MWVDGKANDSIPEAIFLFCLADFIDKIIQALLANNRNQSFLKEGSGIDFLLNKNDEFCRMILY